MPVLEGRAGPPPEADGLFGMTQRTPFAGRDTHGVSGEAGGIPLHPGAMAQDLNFTPMLQSIIDRGAANSLWAEGPEDEGVDIDDRVNKLPGWSRVTAQGSSITIKWVADASSRSGHSVKLECVNGTVGDRAYIEAVVPVDSLGRHMFPAGAFNRNTSSENVGLRIDSQFLKTDGTTTGSEVQRVVWGTNVTGSGDKSAYSWREVPADAMFLRLRIVSHCLITFTGTITDLCREVWAKPPEIQWVTLQAISHGPLTQGGEILLDFVDAGAAASYSRYVPPIGGVLTSISGRLASARTAGTVSVRLRRIGAVTNVLVDLVFDATNTQTNAVVRSLDGVGAWDFGVQETLRLIANPDASWTPQTNDIIATAQIALYDEP